MDVTQMDIAGAFVFTPRQHRDRRGVFLEQLRADVLSDAIGHPFVLAQANVSISARGVVRGIHYAQVPPGQAKYVYCPAGRVLDVVVDIRVGSPTFGVHDAVVLDSERPRAVYLSEGLGHAFVALADASSVTYLLSTGYSPGREFGIHPMDPELDLPWPADLDLELSAKDRAAPTFAEARTLGLLPTMEQCAARYAELRTRTATP
jgi:dTDP-4-dehydrorhamnose 3,5-epimerase